MESSILSNEDVETGHVLMGDLVSFTELNHSQQLFAVQSMSSTIARCPDFHQSDSQLILLDTGDGFSAVFFGDIRTAARAALQIRAVWNSPDLPKIRLGLHSGTITRRSGIGGSPSVTGDAINRAQRVMAAATPGQILMSVDFSSLLKEHDIWKQHIADFGTTFDKHGNANELHELRLFPQPSIQFSPGITTKIKKQFRRIIANPMAVIGVVLLFFIAGFTIGRLTANQRSIDKSGSVFNDTSERIRMLENSVRKIQEGRSGIVQPRIE